MARMFLIVFGIFRRVSRNICKNVGEKILIQFQIIHERVKYRTKKTRHIWKNVKLSRTQKAKINSFYKEHYGKKIPYTYHRLFTGFTGNFDEKYIPEMLYAPYFERFLTDVAYGKVFTDKNMLSVFAKGLNVKMPQNIVLRNKNGYYDNCFNKITCREAEDLLHNTGKVFIKKATDSCGGRGCIVANFVDGVDVTSNKTVSEILSSYSGSLSVQELIACHDSIKTIYPHSVNTFRVITYILDNEVYHCPIIMRMGRGGAVIDNASSGGIFIAVDDDGALHKSAFTEYRDEFTIHPDTNIVFEGQKIENLDKVIKLAERLQLAIPQVACVNWDFTINENGEPVLIEANMRNDQQAGSIWLPQMAHGKGAFGDNTARVLEFIRKTKKLSFTKRQKTFM